MNNENEKIREFMRLSIDAGKHSKPENEEHKPKVGAVLVKDGEVLGFAYRGEKAPGEHAEFTLLEKKLKDKDCSGATLFTTLEPCTERKTKKPCSHWIVDRGIKTVYIGMYDPNPLIFGHGFEYLKTNGIEVLNYPPELTKEIEEDNFEFIQFCKILNNKKIETLEDLPYHLSPHYRTLDDWYNIINRIYFDKNFTKDARLIFTHLVEILGGLSILSTNKVKGLNPEQQMAKALSWWLVICGKMGIRSVEDMLYYKFPNACPYCLSKPHNEEKCRKIRLEHTNPNWNTLLNLGSNTANKRPSSLSSWQQMFYEIYPIHQGDDYDKVLGRFTEEIGELAEAIRVFKVAPSYFLSEAADVFAWLMHLYNLYETRIHPQIEVEERGKFIEKTLFELYPDKCKECNQQICNCPPILKSTIGRITNDGPDLSSFESYNNPFMTKAEISKQFDFSSDSIIISIEQFEVNSSLIKVIYHFCDDLTKELRYVKTDNFHQFDKIIDTLHVISGFACTQRVSQDSINRFLRYIIDLKESEKLLFVESTRRIPQSDFSKSILKFVK